MRKDKRDIITFKVPESLTEAMKGIPNRSEFIRSAVLAALDSLCPLCKGAGMLMPNQKTHWDHFAEHHGMQECPTCHALHLVCSKHPVGEPHKEETS